MIFVAGFNLNGAGSNDLNLAYYGLLGNRIQKGGVRRDRIKTRSLQLDGDPIDHTPVFSFSSWNALPELRISGAIRPSCLDKSIPLQLNYDS
jgi:hypothetical protein